MRRADDDADRMVAANSLNGDPNGNFPPGGCAVVVGATGGIGAAIAARLRGDERFSRVVALSRGGAPPVDVEDESSIAAAAEALADGAPPRLIVDATGVLEGEGCRAEKALAQIEAAAMAKAFAVNAIGPALLMKHWLALLPPHGKSVFATLSARVGSIGDNRLGGWYSYRASKAALNQIVRTAAIELRRRRPDAICIALHPGTVATSLSAPFAKAGLDVQTPERAAARLLTVIDALTVHQSGGFYDARAEPIAW